MKIKLTSVYVDHRNAEGHLRQPHSTRPVGTLLDEEKKVTNRDQYTPGPASGAQVRKDGEKWTLILVRELAPLTGKSLAGAHRPGASARVGSLRGGWKPGYGWSGEAHLGGNAAGF